MFLISEIQF